MAKGTKHRTDEELLARLQDKASEVLEARIEFDSAMQHILNTSE